MGEFKDILSFYEYEIVDKKCNVGVLNWTSVFPVFGSLVQEEC